MTGGKTRSCWAEGQRHGILEAAIYLRDRGGSPLFPWKKRSTYSLVYIKYGTIYILLPAHRWGYGTYHNKISDREKNNRRSNRIVYVGFQFLTKRDASMTPSHLLCQRQKRNIHSLVDRGFEYCYVVYFEVLCTLDVGCEQKNRGKRRNRVYPGRIPALASKPRFAGIPLLSPISVLDVRTEDVGEN